MLRVIQLNTLEDRYVTDKREWDLASKFLESSVREKLKHTESMLKEMLGPSTKERWMYWRYLSEDQKKRNAVKSELDKVLYSDDVSNTISKVNIRLAIILFCFIETSANVKLRRIDDN